MCVLRLATPLLLLRNLEYVVIKPTWTVPPTILRKDILPRLKEDALAYVRDKDMEVLDRSGNAVERGALS